MPRSIELERAHEILGKIAGPLLPESVSLADALDRIVAHDLYAVCDLPPVPQAAIDGFAVVGSAIEERYQVVKIPVDTNVCDLVLDSGQTAHVVTGGMLPQGTQMVIPREQVKVIGSEVVFSGEFISGSNIKSCGEDFRHGELLVSKGARLSAGLIGLLAAFGYMEVPVFRCPKVLVLGIGTQIVPYNKAPKTGETRDSNGPLLASLVKRERGRVIAIEVVGKQKTDDLLPELIRLFEQSDLVITTGGTFATTNGEARVLLERIGAKQLFSEVQLKPGGHVGAAIWNSKPVVLLSGNPAACLVGFELFAVPVLRSLQGVSPVLNRIRARCLNPYSKKRGVRCFLRGHVRCSEEGWTIELLPGQKPSMMRSFLGCNALIDIPPNHPPLKEGDEVSIILLDPNVGGLAGYLT
ncbi:MAG: molybdopterin molybdotransferase MoeA [Desulfitobacteriaceae bacterium]|nr:molybdopterin molybdotransferase MoeA [Desulfitobacteriaceae bacterium]